MDTNHKYSGIIPTDATCSTANAGSNKLKASQNHAKPLAVTGELSELTRLRVGHLMSLFAISHATLYARMREGKIPKPDGMDGRRPYWKTATIRVYLTA